mmetsp:Transcript_26268/g.64016  ORF Transcript_26268/g.64016 Transcript_26268/m.64016 type:complete len:87 (-) Transcript_26268:1045-1305(-)
MVFIEDLRICKNFYSCFFTPSSILLFLLARHVELHFLYDSAPQKASSSFENGLAHQPIKVLSIIQQHCDNNIDDAHEIYGVQLSSE